MSLKGVLLRSLSIRTWRVDIYNLTAYAYGAQKAVESIQTQATVNYVEANQLLYTAATVSQGFPQSWGLRRISTRALPLPDNYTYPARPGADTTVYVLDTGILTTHPDFGGRAVMGHDAIGEGLTDYHGHGTHVASIIGGIEYGVAKNANLVGVKVLNRYGFSSSASTLAGLSWAVENCATLPIKRCVINLSLSSIPGTPVSRALNDAIDRAFAAGIVVVVAAGNENVDTNTKSLASASKAFVIGAIDQTDAKSSYSNFGTTVTNSAPGTDIKAASQCWGTAQPPCYSIFSGTSTAAAHASGVVALVWSQFSRLATPSGVITKVNQLSSPMANAVPRLVFSAFG